MKIEYLKPSQIGGGVGKTPPTSRNLNINEYNLSIDWLSCSFDFLQMDYKNAPPLSWQEREYKKGIEKLNRLFEILTFTDKDEITFYEESKFGYRGGYYVLGEYIKIFFTGPQNKNGLYTNFLDMSGAGCKDFIDRGGDFVKLFDWLLANGAVFTRVDTAVDVFTEKYFTLDKLEQYVINHSYISPLHSWEIVKSGDRTTETHTGKTIYIGSKSSKTLICIYDKKLEQFSKGNETFNEAWIRVEIRFKKDRAEWFVAKFLQHSKGDRDYSFIINALYTVLDFRDRTNSKNRNDWAKCKWWTDFLGDVVKADFGRGEKIPLSIERNKDWLEHSSPKIMSRLFYYNPNGFLELIFKMIIQKHEELDNSDFEAINKARLKQGLPKLTDEEKEQIKNTLDYMLKSYGRKKENE